MTNDPVVQILIGILIAVIAGSIGKVIGARDSIKRPVCDERRKACSGLILTKVEILCQKFDKLELKLDKHLLKNGSK